jgi:hypothetical protein
MLVLLLFLSISIVVIFQSCIDLLFLDVVKLPLKVGKGHGDNMHEGW